MNDARGFGDALGSAASTMLERVASFLPGAIVAVLLVLAGWVLAKAARALTIRATMLLDTMLPRLGLPAGLSRMRMARGSVLAGTVAYWLILLLFVTAATQVLGLQAFTDWLARLLEYLPSLVAGLLILFAGWLLSGFAANLLQATASKLDPGQRDVLARIVRVAILAGAILVGADQIGIRITFLAIFVGAISIAVGGGVALAVGFGAREYVGDLIAAHHLRHALAIGQMLRVGEHEGRLLDVTATDVIIETAEGRVKLSARLVNAQAVTLLARKANG